MAEPPPAVQAQPGTPARDRAADAPLLRFDHVHLRSPDAAAAAAWYVGVLGATLVEQRHGPRPRYELRLGGLTLLINVILPGEACGPAPAAPHAGLEHLGFTVADIDSAAAALAARGAVFELPPTTIRGLRIAFLKGPDGVPIELLQAG
jgi:catechol 2,3-dioxygenase-like lactoylglutathione lyase family enzyme